MANNLEISRRNRYIEILQALMLAIQEEQRIEAAGGAFDLESLIRHAKLYGRNQRVTETELRICLLTLPVDGLEK